MNLKSVMSRFLTFFTLFLALGFGVSESFALTLEPGAAFQPTVYSETITLTAVYVSKTYDVQLDKNGGASGSDAVVATYGEVMPDITVPTRAGYMFEGYFTAKIGGEQYYDTQGKSVKVWNVDSDEPIVLYAHWMANGVCAAGTYYNSSTKKVETCPAGSYCAGGDWNESTNNCAIKSCPTAYPNSVAGAKKEGDCYVSVAAGMYWNGTSAVDCNAGTYKTAHQVYSGQTSSCASCASGYTSDKKASECYLTTSAGMYVATAGAGQVQCKAGDFCVGGVKVMYSKTGGNTSCKTLGAEYSSDAGTKTQDMCYTGCKISSIAHATAVEGHDYYGQSVKDTCVATSCNTGYGVQNGLCEPNVYTITLSGNGASENKVVYQKYAVGWYSDAAATNQIETLTVPSRKYYTFVGYFLGANSGDQITDASGAFISGTDWRKAQLTSNSTLYAHWRANKYTVKYNANGASGTMSDVQHVCDEAKNLTTNAFTSASDDSQFLGWSTKSGATVAEYTNGQSVVNLAENDGAVVTLYPVWKACTKCAPGAGASCALTAPKGVCTYSTTCKANYENLQNSGKYNPSCSAVKYGLSYVLNGGAFISGYGAVAECSVASGEITLPTAENLVREDYRFAGWYDNEALTGNPVYSLPAGTCVANKKFYAKWTVGIEMCEQGQYYNGTTFVACPKGYYCPGEGKVSKGTPGCSVECPAGYRDGGTGYASQSQCQMSVPQGSYLATAKGTQTTVCPAGKYTAAAVKVEYGKTSECASCEANSYCTSGKKYSCSDKTGGVFVNSAAGSDSINSCYTKTVAGKYIMDNAVKSCPAPYYCPGNVTVYYGQTGGTKVCADLSTTVEWISGITTDGATSPDKCYVSVAAGMYWNGTSAADCNAGTYKTAHQVNYGQTSSCASCASGYTSDKKASECYLTTSAGKYVATAGAGQVQCKAGDFCVGGVKVMYSKTGGNTSCKTLGAEYSSDAGISNQDMCYKSCADASSATNMTGRDYYGSDVADTCQAASCQSGYTVVDGVCELCPADHVCDSARDNGKPYACSDLTDGVYTKSEAGSGSVNDCYLMTSAGMYVATAGAGQVQCKAGDFCEGGVKVMYSKTGGNTSCTTLGSGYSSDKGIKTKDMCFKSCADASGVANMTGRDYYGSDVADTCQAASCQSGYTVVDGVCELCPADHVCDSARDNGKPYACSDLTDGVYTKSEAGSGSVNECYLMTSAGNYVAKAGAGQQECVAGYYCPGAQKVMFNTIGGRNNCPGGFASSDAGAKVAEDCYTTCSMYPNAIQMSGRDYYGAAQDTCEAIECEKGYTLNNGFCGSCPADHVCDPMYDSGKPHSCSELTGGKYTKAAANSASIDACYVLTSAGNYVAVASQGEVPCKVGDYCPGGTKVMYTGKGGSVACSSLGAGYSSDAGAKAETQCYQGCASVTNALQMSGRDYYGSDDMDTCAVSICVAGFTVVDGKCSQCPVNHVCDPVRDDGKPYTCSDLTGGIYSRSEVGAGSIDACYLLTEAGKYVAAKGAGQVECAEDGYCTGSVVVRRDAIGGRTECPSGFERSDVGASSARQCYAGCANTEKATAMSGRDYYGSDSMDTCLATSCVAGFTVVNGKCSQCPENHVCDPVRDNGKPYTCSELTIGVYVNSNAGTGSVDNCYLVTDAGMYVARAGAGQVLCAEDGYCMGGVSVQRNAVGGRTECPVGFAMSDAGATNVQQCFTTCTLASNAEQMVGRDYYANGKDTCAVVMCAPGYTLSNGRCVLCPADHVCHPEMESGTPVACTDLTRGTHGFALAGSDSVSDCYTACEPYDVEYGTAVQLSDTEFYPAQCRYKGVSVTGNPCKIVDGLCVETSCNHNYEMINGKCAACARENAISYKQNGGNCVVESCVSGFHPNGQSCEINVAECSAPNALSAKREWNATKQSFGECIVTECAEGYHLGANVCQSDEQVCELEHGVGVREWNHKAKKWGDCIATKCDPGYTSDPGQTNELWKQCGRCNNMYSAGGELAASSYVDGCEIASCMYDGELYTLENNECVLICDTYSDETGSRKWNASRKKCERTCSPGYMSW